MPLLSPDVRVRQTSVHLTPKPPSPAAAAGFDRAVGLSCLTLVIGRFSRDYRGLRFKNTIIPLPYVGPGSIRGASTGADQDGKRADSVAKPAAGQCEEERPRSRD